MLKFKFDSKQEHQIRGIESVVNLFDGIQRIDDEFKMVTDETIANITTDETWHDNDRFLLGNLNFVQSNNDLSSSTRIFVDDGPMLEGVSIDTHRYPVYTVEMETGTGKTYVYLRTVFELKKKYGFRKFIVVVPSIAIYEGVIKTFEVTKEHFKTLYGNEVAFLTQYDGQQISKLRNFASSSFIEIIVITLDSFNKKSNTIFKPSEKLQGEKKPFEYIQETRPILILDESQNYLSEKSRMALRTLKPLFAINYSATPIRRDNLIYRLSPVDAFKMDLVKKIQVYGVEEQYNFNNAQTRLELNSIKRTTYGIKAKFKTIVYTNGIPQDGEIEVGKGDDLYQKTGNEAFNGIVVDEIDLANNFVSFSNGEEKRINDMADDRFSKREIFRQQIEETIKQHISRQNELIHKNIKVLSLFFIDRVTNYTDDKGVIKVLFDAAFEKYKDGCELYKNLAANEVREGYFASRKTKQGTEEFIDTNLEESKKTKDEKEAEKNAYELIMKNKERMLSFEEKVCFIFAHSALKEGWDNPNVFQICTLNNTVSEVKKRQEIGRGLRLCVNQDGERIQEEGVNILTVVANESYEKYVEGLQQEYVETGDIAPQKPTNARKAEAVRNNKVFKSKEFKEFWDNLCKKTKYNIKIETEELIKECINRLNCQQYPEPQLIITRGSFVITKFKIELIETNKEKARIKITITNTNNEETVINQVYKKGNDLSRIIKDDRLKGYKIVEVTKEFGESTVYFGNNQKITKEESVTFETDKSKLNNPRTVMASQTTYPVFNLIDRTIKETDITRKTILEIFKGMEEDKKKNIFKNPEGFASVFINTIRNQLADHIAERIEYIMEKQLNQKAEEYFPDRKKYPQKEIIEGSKSSMYDYVQIDSDVERRFVEHRIIKDDEDGNVLCYFKFPSSFKINLPKIIGNYIPDWGIIRFDKEKKATMQLIRETKGTMNTKNLQFPNEVRKIKCAKKHFKEIDIDYKQIDDSVINYWL